MLIQEDFLTYQGDTRIEYPIIPGRVAIGKIAETSGENAFGYERGMKVYLHSTVNCGACFKCSEGDYKHCTSFKIAGKTCDGFLRDFAIMDNNDVSVLPSSVSESEALFIDHVAICNRIIDSINLEKGEHVVIVGGDILGIILAQLIIYYQGVPILVDNNNDIWILRKTRASTTLFLRIIKSKKAFANSRAQEWRKKSFI